MKRSSTLFLRSIALAGLTGTILLLLAWNTGRVPTAQAYHTQEELDAYARSAGLTSASNTYFRGSGTCNGCHGHDPEGIAMVTQTDSVDVNVVDDWRSTMMANSARDPLWRAKVSHETTVNPGHQTELEDKCTSCHAPAARHNKHLLGLGPYSIAELEQDPMALDGVSCVPCHIQSNDSIGERFSGELKFDTAGRPLYGPYGEVFSAPMTAFVGYTPQYGAQIADAGLCAGCHTLATSTADLNGNLTGTTFFEQATYHEWLNSRFNNREHGEDGITCQGCHVPSINDGVVLSANYLFLQPKSPFGLHHFAGANTFMLNMLKDHIDPLELTANETQFDSTIARTQRMLHSGAMVEAHMDYRDEDTAYVNVKLTDLAGHKFPSGYPSRRAWVELVVTNAVGDTVFRSGGYDNTYEIIGHDPVYEPHYDVITQPDQVQIYELVMGDVNNDKTTVLERAAVKLKDNRLVPQLFTTSHYSYDTSAIAGVPVSDIDFNHDGMGVEGSGSDIVHYHVPTGGYIGLLNVQARVWYQSVPPKWLNEMFGLHTGPIDAFRDMYEQADNTPLLVTETAFSDLSVGVDDLQELGVHIAPNPVRNGVLNVTGLDERVIDVAVYDASGRAVGHRGASADRNWSMRLPEEAGTYLVVFRTRTRSFVQRVVSF